MSAPADVAIIGGGIVGCAAAAFLAEAGVRVEVFERAEVGAAASGRNSGSIQHPFDPVLAALHLETLDHYRGMEDVGLRGEPAGVLLLAPEREPLEPAVGEIARDCPELRPALLDPDELRDIEPALAPGLWACRLETGCPVRPLAATRAFAGAPSPAALASTKRRPRGRGSPAAVRTVCCRPACGARRAPWCWPPDRGPPR